MNDTTEPTCSADQSPIAMQIAVQDDRLKDLRHRLAKLSGRLTPVSRPRSTEGNAVAPATPAAPRMPVGTMLGLLENQSKQVEELIQTVERTIDLLEI